MWLFATSQRSIPEFGLPFEGKGNPYLLVLEDCDQQLLYIGIQHVLCVYISPIWKRKYDLREFITHLQAVFFIVIRWASTVAMN